MTIILDVIYGLFWLITAAFCVIVLWSGFTHGGPDERDSRTRQEYTDKINPKPSDEK